MSHRKRWAALKSRCFQWYDVGYGICLGTFGYMLDEWGAQQKQSIQFDQGENSEEHAGGFLWQIEREEAATPEAAQ